MIWTIHQILINLRYIILVHVLILSPTDKLLSLFSNNSVLFFVLYSFCLTLKYFIYFYLVHIERIVMFFSMKSLIADWWIQFLIVYTWRYDSILFFAFIFASHNLVNAKVLDFLPIITISYLIWVYNNIFNNKIVKLFSVNFIIVYKLNSYLFIILWWAKGIHA